MHKLNSIEISKLNQKFYCHFVNYPLINAVSNQIIMGFVYADELRTKYFICTKFGWSLIYSENKDDYYSMFLFLMENRLIPDYIHIYSPENSFISIVEKNWRKIKIRERIQLKYLSNNYSFDSVSLLPDGYSLLQIQEIEFSRLEIFGLDLSNRYWQSEIDFLNNAIGTCLLNELNEPVAICYSICIVENVAEIDILVLPQYTGKNFGYIVASNFIKYATETGCISHWDTFADNKPSFYLANKLKFVEIKRYDLVSIFLRNW